MTFDVLIIGGGLVGASLAAALKSSGLNMALVETQPTAHSNDGWDNRIYAISPGGAAFLTQCDAWQQLDMNRVQPVETMRVFGDEPGKSSAAASAMARITRAGQFNLVSPGALCQPGLA